MNAGAGKGCERMQRDSLNLPRRRRPAARWALLSVPLFALLTACGGGGGGVDGAPDTATEQRRDERGGGGGGTSGDGTLAPGGSASIGVQSVADTPVEALPEHEGHQPLEAGGPVAAAPGGPDFKSTETLREWVVSPEGDDAAAGSADAPFRTISHAITQASPGDMIRVLAGTYAEKVLIGEQVRAGEPGRPITLQGEGRPKIVPTDGSLGLIDIARPHWIVDGFELDLQGQRRFAVTFQGDVNGSVLANSDLHSGTLGGGVTTFAYADGARIENNHIHNFDQGSTDSHGVVVQPTSRNVSIRFNDIHNTSGDSVQCLGPEGFSNDPPAQGVIIEANHFYSTRENAVDIKTCHDVEIRHNRMHGFQAVDSSKGDAVVVHYSATNVLVEENEIYNAGTGISVGGNREGPMPSGVVIRRNRIRDIHADGGAFGHGIRVENASAPVVVHNTVTGTAGPGLVLGRGTGGPTENAEVSNNIVDTAVGVRLGNQAPGLVTSANLFRPDATFEHADAAEPLNLDAFRAMGFGDSLGEDPGLSGEKLSPGPAAVDRGADRGEAYCGAAPDIGAVETDC